MAPRIAHLTTAHQPFDPRIFHRECRSLAEAGFDVHIVSPHSADERRSGVSIHALALGGGRRHRAALQRHALRQARRLDADLYHIHDPELIPAAFALKQSTGARIVYDMHEDYAARGGVEGRGIRALERWCFTWVDHVIISDASYARHTRRSSVPTKLVANYFRKPDTISLVAEQDSRFTLVYTGVNSFPRGLDHLIALARAIRREGLPWRIRLAGVCYLEEHRRWTLDQVWVHGLDDVLEWDGQGRYLPWERLQAHHRQADVGLVLMHPTPNYRRCLPTKFYEYLHAGLPILCSDFALWRQFVQANGCGAVVAPDDTDGLVQQLQDWSDGAGRSRIAASARAAAPRFDWAVMAQRLVDVCRQLTQ